MQQTVGIEPVILGTTAFGGTGGAVGVSRPIIQNLGPGDLYLDFSSAVAIGSGVKLIPNERLEFGGRLAQALYVVASQAATDVRFIDAG